MMAKKHCLFLFIFALMVFFIGCDKGHDKASNKEIQTYTFQVGKMKNWLEIPARYQVKRLENLLTIHARYPDMQPNVESETTKMDMSANVRILIYTKKLDEVAAFLGGVENQGASCLTDGICAAHKIGKQGEYEIFKQGLPHDHINREGKAATYYLFQASDGEKVLVKDLGAQVRSYVVNRSIDGLLRVQYQVPRLPNSNFVEMDNIVTGFIKKHLRFKQFKEDKSL